MRYTWYINVVRSAIFIHNYNTSLIFRCRLKRWKMMFFRPALNAFFLPGAVGGKVEIPSYIIHKRIVLFVQAHHLRGGRSDAPKKDLI